MLQRVFVRSLLATAIFFVFSTGAASAANLLVDDNGVDCPAAGFSHIQPAVEAANSGDTLIICPGTYAEGPGTAGTNGVTITKSLTLKGAGADKVTIKPTPETASGGQIAAASPNLRDATGNIITVAGTPEEPIQVAISGVTVSGGGTQTYFSGTNIWNGEFQNGVYAETGITFLDAGGSVRASRVTNVVTSELAAAASQPGGYRSNNFGWGIAQVTAATAAPANPARALTISGTRLERYNKGGVLIDGATGDTFPLTPAGVANSATISSSQIVGRNLNSPPNDGTGGGSLLTTGTVFGQDGVRATAGSTLSMSSGNVTQNLMAGAGSNTAAQLSGAAGVRLVGAASSTVTKSNILENGYGLVNVTLDGTTPNTAVPANAPNNFWGYPGTSGASNTGPAVSPTTLPVLPSNPVNGSVDATFGSDAVHFLPYRSGNLADSNGYWPIQDAPVPVADAAPTVSLSANLPRVDAGAQLTLTANASDDFGIKSLTFYDGDDEIAVVTPPANSYTWTAPVDCSGDHNFSVLAEDSSGQSAFADLTVGCPDANPTVTLTGDPNPVAPGGTVELTADVEDDDAISSVTFYEGPNYLGAFSPPAGTASWSKSIDWTAPSTCGVTRTLKVVVRDSTNQATTQTIDISTTACPDFDPTISVSATPSSVDPGEDVTFSAEVTDDIRIASISFYDGANLISTETPPSNLDEWTKSVTWTAPLNSCGTSHTLKAIVTDSGGNTAEDSETVTVTACPDGFPTASVSANPTTVAAGGEVTLTGNATDDSGVVSLSFYAGEDLIETVEIDPADTDVSESVEWTAPETCGVDTGITVVAEDTGGNEKTSDEITVSTTTCPDEDPEVTLGADPTTVDAGGNVALSADATDDVGVVSITLYDGDTEITTFTGSDTESLSGSTNWAAPDACGTTRVLRAVAEDTAGNTASDEVTITIKDCVPQPPASPTITLTSPPTTIGPAGTTVTAEVTAAAGVKTVVFFLGDRALCTVTAAPYTCEVLPNGSEVGGQSLRAVVTDSLDRSASADAAVTVSKFKPAALTANAKRIGKKKARIKITGALKLPARVTAAEGCVKSHLNVSAKQGKKMLYNRQVKLTAKCGYSLGFGAKKTKKNRKQKVRVKVSFPGNEVLSPATATRKVR